MSEQYVLISGAAGGIGLATVRRLCAAGFKVFAGVLDETESEAIAAQALADAIPLRLDVRSESSIDAAVQEMSARMGANDRLVGLVNNAGVNVNAPLQYLSVAEIRQMIEVNLLGAILLTRATLPLLRRGESRAVFTGSAMGFMATPTVSTYAATKFAIEGLCDALRVELAPLGIRVMVIEPGVVRTPMTAASPGILARMLERMSPEDRTRYEGLMRKIVDMSVKPGAGIEPQAVANAIHEALTARRPKTRYPVGGDSKAVSWLRHLPDGARDALQRRIFGL